MSTPVVMPQMGESIAEGTIVRWIKKVGDSRRSRRAAVRDLDRQGRRRDPVAGGRHAARDHGQGRRDRPGQQRRRDDRRSGRSRARPRRAAAAAATAPCGGKTAAPTPQADGTTSRRHARTAAPAPARSRRLHRALAAAAAPRSCRSRPARSRRPAPPAGPRRSCAASRRNTASTSARSPASGIGGRVTKHDILAIIETRRCRRTALAACRTRARCTAPAAPRAHAAALRPTHLVPRPTASSRCR